MTRYFVHIFILIFSALTASNQRPPPIANLESNSESVIAGKINVITGELIESSVDLHFAAVEPFYFHRIYMRSEADFGCKWSGWEHNYLKGMVVKYEQKWSRSLTDAVLRDEGGSTLRLRHRSKDGLIFKLHSKKDGKGISNVSRGIISGRSNVINTTVKFDENLKHATMLNGSGVKRKFYNCTTNGQDSLFYKELWERRPNGFHLFYQFETIDDQNQEIVCLTVPNSGREAGRFIINEIKETPGKDEANCRVSSSDGKETQIRFKKLKPKDYVSKFFVDKVTKQHGIDEEYIYHPISCRLLEKKLPEGRGYKVDYYEEGDNIVGPSKYNFCERNLSKTKVFIKDGEWLHGRTRRLYEPTYGNSCEHVETYRFVYAQDRIIKRGEKLNTTEVYDANNHLTIYQHSKECRLKNIDWYSGEGPKASKYCSEELFWGDKENGKDLFLTAKYIHKLNETNTFLAKSYTYDEVGNVKREITSGNFSGNVVTKPKFTNDGTITNPEEIESLEKTYEYQTTLNLLTKEIHPNGLVEEYTYLIAQDRRNERDTYQTDLITSKITLFNDEVCKRVFNRYDDENFLIETVEDDGTTRNKNDIDNITFRKITRHQPKKDSFCIGFAESITELYLDLSTRNEVMISRVEHDFDLSGKIKIMRVYDADNLCRYTLEWAYDDHGNCILETTKSGETIKRSYDNNDNLCTEEWLYSGKKKEYSYDYMNRLLSEKETLSTGVALTTRHSYDLMGNKISTEDIYGQITLFKYDSFNRLIETILPEVELYNGSIYRPTVSEQYNIFSQITEKTDSKGNTVSTRYNSLGKPLHILYPDGTDESFTYTSLGILESHKNKLGGYIYYKFDHFDRETNRTEYDKDGNLLSEEKNTYNSYFLETSTDALNHVKQFNYDSAGRISAIIEGDRRTEITYDSMGRKYSITQFDKGIFLTRLVQEYNIEDRVVEERIEDEKSTILCLTEYMYDHAGNQTGVKKGNSLWITEFNTLNQPTKTITPYGETTYIFYDYEHINHLGQRVLCQTTVDPNGQRESVIFDTLHRHNKIITQDSFGNLLKETTIYYDECSNKAKVVETLIGRKGTPKTLEIQYDSLNRAKTLKEGSKTTKYTYSKDGQKEKIIKPDGTEITHDYDSKGRLISLKSSDGTIDYTYKYNPRNELIKVENLVVNSETTRSYTVSGKLEEEKLQNGLSISYTYDGLDRLVELLLPDHSSIKYVYNALNMTSCKRFNSKGVLVWNHEYTSFDEMGNVKTQKSIGQAGNVKFDYDAMYRLKSIEHKSFKEDKIQYNSTGQITYYQIDDSKGVDTHKLSYDLLYQINTDQGLESTDIYAHDSLYNRTAHNDFEYTINTLNQIETQRDTNYTYDDNGNLILKQCPNGDTKYKYDALDRLIEVEVDGIKHYYEYDPFNRRVRKGNAEQSNYLFIGEDEIGVSSGGVITELRVLGIGTNAEIGASIAMEIHGETYAPIHDHRGNIVTLINAKSGKVEECIRYTLFGESQSDTSITPWRFSSKRLDPETNLTYFGRRFYDSEIGRWTTCDPKGVEASSNLYAYVNNDPLSQIDLYGLELECINQSFGTSIRETLNYGVGMLYSGTKFVISCIGWTIEQIGFHVGIPIIRDLMASLGQLLQGNLSWQPHYPTVHALNILVEGSDTNSNIKRIFINGIANDSDESLGSAKTLLDGQSHVIDIYSTDHGIVGNLISTVMNWMSYDTSSCLELVKAISTQLNDSASNIVEVHAHSRGAAVLANALGRLSHEERARITTVTYGGASFIDPCMAGRVVNYVAGCDLIPRLCNPISYFKMLFGHTSNVVGIHSSLDPIRVHDFRGDAYQSAKDLILQNNLIWQH